MQNTHCCMQMSTCMCVCLSTVRMHSLRTEMIFGQTKNNKAGFESTRTHANSIEIRKKVCHKFAWIDFVCCSRLPFDALTLNRKIPRQTAHARWICPIFYSMWRFIAVFLFAYYGDPTIPTDSIASEILHESRISICCAICWNMV